MRNLKIMFIVMVVFFGYLAISDAIKSRPDDSEWFAQIWDYATESGDSRTVGATLEAIEKKREARFIPALERFITIRRYTSPFRAQAVYTLYKLGSSNTEKDFNRLLWDKTQFETELWPRQSLEKYEALKYMDELGVKLKPFAVEEVKKDILELDKLGYPDYVLKLMGGLKLHGVELTDEQKDMISEHISHNWRRVKPEILKMAGIQLDWDSMFAAQYKKEDKYRQKFLEICKLMLVSVDEESRARYAREYDADSDENNNVKMFRTIMGATVGNKDAIDRIVNDLHFHLAYHCMPVVDLLPDEVLLAFFTIWEKEHKSLGPELLEEMNKRGYRKRVNALLKDCENIARDRGIEKSGNPLSIANILGPLTQIDCGRYLDILSELLQENPDSQYLAGRIIQCIELSRYSNEFGEFPGMDEWIEKNPEKLVMAIKTLLKAKKGMLPARIKRDMEVGLIDSPLSYHSISSATTAMLRLDEKTFNKHFGNPDKMYFTKSAFLVGNYFEAKWAYKKNQDKFYKRYERK